MMRKSIGIRCVATDRHCHLSDVGRDILMQTKYKSPCIITIWFFLLSLYSLSFRCRYRFVELYYRRVETVRKGRIIPARTQTVVLFLPDVRSCLPTRLEWDELSIKYKKHLEMKQQSNEGDDDVDEDHADVEKKQSHSKLTKSDNTTNDGVETTDMEMADKAKNSDNETNTAGDAESQNSEQIDPSDTKATTESEPATNAATILKALLNIISNFTTDILIIWF